MAESEDPQRARRLELILQQVDSLPTLPAVAARLLQVTSDEQAEARHVAELVHSDPPLTAKVLALCRTAEKGAKGVSTVDRAVVMLGFEAVRNAVLSIKVFETFAGENGTDTSPDDPEAAGTERFNRPAFWRHSLGVGIAAELIARRHPRQLDPHGPGEAFVCGLLHDVGKLALEYLLPRSFQRVVELSERHQLNIADAERRVIGLDHRTVGKRLAEHWGLPDTLRDCIWLHGTPRRALPEPERAPLIGLISTADLLVRRQHLGYSGNHEFAESLEAVARDAGLDPTLVHEAGEQLHDQLKQRADAIGLGSPPSRKLFQESIMQANTALGRLNRQLSDQRRRTAGQTTALQAIRAFHSETPGSQPSIMDVLAAVAHSAGAVLGEGFYALAHQPAAGQPWTLAQYRADGRLLKGELVEPPEEAPDLSHFDAQPDGSLPLTGNLAWLSSYLVSQAEPDALHVLPLPSGDGTAAVLIHDRPALPAEAQRDALRWTWGAAIASAAQHQAAHRLNERLVQTSRKLAETQQQLARRESLARLGEMAAGAAHEMNNPLAVISGRAQLLAGRLEDGTDEQRDAELIHRRAQQLSDLITSLRLFAEPPEPTFAEVHPADVLDRAVWRLQQREPGARAPQTDGFDEAPPLHTDGEQLAQALAEVLVNAHQASEGQPVHLSASADPVNDRFVWRVTDRGAGMDAKTRQHAFDPFFSAKPAGRQPGLGLPRAQRLIEGLGGTIELTSAPREGTAVTLSVPLRSEAATTEAAPPREPAEQASPVGSRA